MAKNGNKPVHEIRMGRIKAAIWANETQTGTRHNVSLQRIYKDDGGEWQTSDSFGRDDLPLLAKVVTRLTRGFTSKLQPPSVTAAAMKGSSRHVV